MIGNRGQQAGVVGVDVGGTFTDVVDVSSDGGLRYGKALTSPADMRHGIGAALEETEARLDDVKFLFHGTTTVINALLERRGATVGLITTQGMRDVYELGRGSRSEPFDMLFEPPRPLVPRIRRVEIVERIAGDGSVITPLDEQSVREAAAALASHGVDAIAICLLNSYVSPVHEETVRAILTEEHANWELSVSHELVREWREYERTSTTAMDAYVKPLMRGYLSTLQKFLSDRGLGGQALILQSNGGAITPEMASQQPLRLVESGPAAGIVAARELAERLDLRSVVAFDMGGTTAKAALVEDFTFSTVRPYFVGGREGLPSLLPVVDIVEIGAGGGSIAYLDEAGAMKVGPRSAGADPGPASYGRGGSEPTITDAHVVLGHIHPEHFLGGRMGLDRASAAHAIERAICAPLGMDLHRAAQGILDIADNKMALLLRQVSVQRGKDPRTLALMASGGAGPLHATSIARQLGIRTVVVPSHPAHFSAYGMLLSDVKNELVLTLADVWSGERLETVKAAMAQLTEQMSAAGGFDASDDQEFAWTYLAELCYEGQAHTLRIEISSDLDLAGIEATAEEFHRRHAEVHGFAVPSEPIAVLALMVIRTLPLGIDLAGLGVAVGSGNGDASREQQRDIVLQDVTVSATVIERDDLNVDTLIEGPAVIEEQAATSILGVGDVARVDETGSLIVDVKG